MLIIWVSDPDGNISNEEVTKIQECQRKYWDKEEITGVKVVGCSPSTKGYLFEVDLEYPTELHDYHDDFPLAPERIIPKYDWLSPMQQTYLKSKKVIQSPKLITSLFNKERYILFHENLFWYMRNGLKLTKVHRVIEFNQKPWMEPYIRFNTMKRSHAKTDFEKDFYKLLNNSVFGKTMENVRNYKDVKLLNNSKQITSMISKPTCHLFNIIILIFH